MEKTTLYIPSEIQVGLRLLARRTGRSQADLVRQALRDLLDREEPPPLLSLGSGYDPELSGADVEDWLAANWRPEEDWDQEPRSQRSPE